LLLRQQPKRQHANLDQGLKQAKVMVELGLVEKQQFVD
jgi:hypothetical protein